MTNRIFVFVVISNFNLKCSYVATVKRDREITMAKQLNMQIQIQRATQRATAQALGVGVATVNRDILQHYKSLSKRFELCLRNQNLLWSHHVANATKPELKPALVKDIKNELVANATEPHTPPPSSMTLSGEEAARAGVNFTKLTLPGLV